MAFKKDFRPDIILSNPPYANGSDIDFVFDSFKLFKIALIEITPAKFQTSEDTQKIVSNKTYGNFRKEIIPYIKELIFYPNCRNIFDIFQIDGIALYCITKKFIDKAIVHNRCIDIKLLNSTEYRDIKDRQSLLNIGNEVINKLNIDKSFVFPEINHNKRYEIWTNTKIAGFDWFSEHESKYVLGISRITDNSKNQVYDGEAKCIFESDSLEECRYFLSWIYSKPVRFLLMANISKLNNIFTTNCFRFIPNKTIFNKLYNDDIILEEYGIQEYKDVISRLIKERDIDKMLEDTK